MPLRHRRNGVDFRGDDPCMGLKIKHHLTPPRKCCDRPGSYRNGAMHTDHSSRMILTFHARNETEA